jgi:hypothetical protein
VRGLRTSPSDLQLNHILIRAGNARVAFASSRRAAVQVHALQQTDADMTEIPRRSVLASGMLLSAAAVASSVTVPSPAEANLVLSGDWEQVTKHSAAHYASRLLG